MQSHPWQILVRIWSDPSGTDRSVDPVPDAPTISCRPSRPTLQALIFENHSAVQKHGGAWNLARRDLPDRARVTTAWRVGRSRG